jgi:hypothetical protein
MEFLPMVRGAFHSVHIGARICGMPCYIKPLWDGSSQKELGQVMNGKRSHLSGKSTEKRTILFVSSKISQAQILCDRME